MYPSSISNLATELINLCKQKEIRIATAESCTAGLIAGSLTEIAGSSAVFERGFNTYSNESKCELLGVSPDDIMAFGSVSQQVAGQMAEGALNIAPVQLTAAVTGIAGPDGGTPEKPVGTVHIASAYKGKSILNKEFLFTGDRQKVRLDAVRAALSMMMRQVAD